MDLKIKINSFTTDDIDKIDREWERECNEYYFTHRGLDCAVIRNKYTLALNGYVSVPDSHLLSGVKYTDICHKISVHGGLTFSGIVKELGNKWTFGFDCSHAGDLLPIVLSIDSSIPGYALSGVYRNVNYVMRELRGLANRLIELNNPFSE